ncbi:MAG: hypothetical protein JWO37_3767 [Acidimicrobiales bacterium]|nr:hypothetical protein [Acidimicrobiales bacterium]
MLGLAWAGMRVLLPKGLPNGILLLGVILGSLTGLTAVGLVLVYRVVRAINLAQAEIGGLAAATALVLIIGRHVPYLIAVPCGLVVAAAAGLVVEAIMYRLRDAPRLIVTVATIGIAQIVAGFEILLPHLASHLGPSTQFTTPFHFRFGVSPVTFTGDSLAVVVVVPVVVAATGLLVMRTDSGRALRAVADSDERALLVGIPIRRILRIAWVSAAVLSAIGALLTVPILGSRPGEAVGPAALLAPLAAAAIGRMESLKVTFVAAIALGILQQAIYWSYPSFVSVSDLVMFGVIAISLLLSRRSMSRVRDLGLGRFSATREPRPVAPELAQRPRIRTMRAGGRVLVIAVALALPLVLSPANVTVATYMAIFAMVTLSLVVLSGWAGQVSLGHFAFVGLGAAITAELMTVHGLDLFAALALAGLVAALASVVVGLPVLRLSGQFAAVTTLAFAIPVSSILLNAVHFRSFNPVSLGRPVLLERFPLDSTRSFYYFCIGALVVTYVLVRNVRASRLGRTLIAVRDNELAAASWSISPARAKTIAYATAGAIAGVAGGLYAIGLRGMPSQGFSPLLSLQVFTMVVIGGLGSVQGAIVGAIYVVAVQSLFGGVTSYVVGVARSLSFLLTGGGLLLILVQYPDGLGGMLFRARDWLYARISGAPQSRLGLDAPSDGTAAGAGTAEPGEEQAGRVPLLTWAGIDAGYDKVQVLFDAQGSIGGGEVLALLGTNGAGKSTVLRVLSGICTPSGGRVQFDGVDITSATPGRRLGLGIVTVQGGHGVFPSLTVDENLRLMGWTVRKDHGRLSAAIGRVYETFPRLAERRGELAGQLSGGEQQMLATSQALICPTRVLLIDELTLGLAPAAVTALFGAIGLLVAEGTTVLLVEQSLNTAALIAERCLFMERGQTRYSGSIAGLLERDDLARSVFLRESSRAVRDKIQVSTARTTAAGQASATALQAVGLAKCFGGINALQDVSLDVTSGEITGLIGANGAGKTTLLDVCSGFVVPDSGSVSFAGHDITELPAHDRAELGLGRLFQDARLVPAMTVRESVVTAQERHLAVREPLACILGLSAAGESERVALAHAEDLIELFGLGEYANSFVRELSTGTRRIVELACAVAHEPSVLLLDEPTAGIAQREVEALAQLLSDLRSSLGLTLLIVEHDLNFIHGIADRLVCMDLGRELVTGEPDAVLSDPEVLHAYFGIDNDRRGRRKSTQSTKSQTGERAMAGTASATRDRSRKVAGARPGTARTARERTAKPEPAHRPKEEGQP